MLAGKITAAVYGANDELTIEMEGTAREFVSGQRVLVTIIPDDGEIERAYERGKADGSEQEIWELEEHLRRRDRA